MINAKATVTIRKPVDAVWVFVGTGYVQNHPKWDPRTIKTELKGSMAKGAQGTEVRRQGGRNTTYQFEVTEFMPNEKVSFKASGSSVSLIWSYVVRPTEKGTQLTIDMNIAFGGLMRLFQPLLGRSVRAEVSKNASEIKRLLESQ